MVKNDKRRDSKDKESKKTRSPSLRGPAASTKKNAPFKEAGIEAENRDPETTEQVEMTDQGVEDVAKVGDEGSGPSEESTVAETTEKELVPPAASEVVISEPSGGHTKAYYDGTNPESAISAEMKKVTILPLLEFPDLDDSILDNEYDQPQAQISKEVEDELLAKEVAEEVLDNTVAAVAKYLPQILLSIRKLECNVDSITKQLSEFPKNLLETVEFQNLTVLNDLETLATKKDLEDLASTLTTDVVTKKMWDELKESLGPLEKLGEIEEQIRQSLENNKTLLDRRDQLQSQLHGYNRRAGTDRKHVVQKVLEFNALAQKIKILYQSIRGYLAYKTKLMDQDKKLLEVINSTMEVKSMQVPSVEETDELEIDGVEAEEALMDAFERTAEKELQKDQAQEEQKKRQILTCFMCAEDHKAADCQYVKGKDYIYRRGFMADQNKCLKCGRKGCDGESRCKRREIKCDKCLKFMPQSLDLLHHPLMCPWRYQKKTSDPAEDGQVEELPDPAPEAVAPATAEAPKSSAPAEAPKDESINKAARETPTTRSSPSNQPSSAKKLLNQNKSSQSVMVPRSQPSQSLQSKLPSRVVQAKRRRTRRRNTAGRRRRAPRSVAVIRSPLTMIRSVRPRNLETETVETAAVARAIVAATIVAAATAIAAEAVETVPRRKEPEQMPSTVTDHEEAILAISKSLGTRDFPLVKFYNH